MVNLKNKLPIYDQLIPVLDMRIMDLSGDGFNDVILMENIYNTEIETPRFDNGTGLALLSNQKDGFNPYYSSGELIRIIIFYDWILTFRLFFYLFCFHFLMSKHRYPTVVDFYFSTTSIE